MRDSKSSKSIMSIMSDSKSVMSNMEGDKNKEKVQTYYNIFELPERNVNGDTTLTLGLQLVKNPCVLEGTLAEFCGFL
ncbi:hypothetical protein SNOG_20125 [Parastagonospora nodorum SN15]|uniref:Uncharacterized protein n=1 Tax=Phaeosphaeria nodorum (strain SN15 / ATCC MYA-4574 / FGSC 10173) TaxID=321614 RepID=A9JXC1_PHANO|nr:hypothetical protein SNOG_20125 [Parastagonospora nodorum SN15]EDP89811.1 hypothetical protein SNOG_20125 [Parastagonospora nodorum SN15]